MPLPDAAPAFVWVEALGEPGDEITLSKEASHHVGRVCRARAGEGLSLVDGRGGIARGRILALGARVSVALDSIERVGRGAEATLVCGPPEGLRFDWAIEKLAELGIARVRLADCERGGWERSVTRIERWRRIAVAALQQSRGRFLLIVEPAVRLEEALDGHPEGGLRVTADPAGGPAHRLQPPRQGATLVAVGPAGGFSATEKDSLVRRGFEAISLSGSRLRSETAAVAAAAWWASAVVSQG